jgi:hypothetical protein
VLFLSSSSDFFSSGLLRKRHSQLRLRTRRAAQARALRR